MKDAFEYGLECGFPLCCVIFFCFVWTPLRSEHKMFSGRPECYDYEHENVGYVMCPECVINKITERSGSQ